MGQSCFNQTYCYDVSAGKHRVEKLFTIRNKEIVEGLMQWCYDNGWSWRGEDYISDEWMGGDD